MLIVYSLSLVLTLHTILKKQMSLEKLIEEAEVNDVNLKLYEEQGM